MAKVIVIDRNNCVLGEEDKLIAHLYNVRHRAFSVFCVNDADELLLQKRSHGKYHSPGLWTNTCCSHPAKNTHDTDEIHERLHFEMGFATGVEYCFTHNYQAYLGAGLYENEIDRIYLARYSGPVKPNPQEVSETKWVSLYTLPVMIDEAPSAYTVWFRSILPLFISYIRKS